MFVRLWWRLKRLFGVKEKKKPVQKGISIPTAPVIVTKGLVD